MARVFGAILSPRTAFMTRIFISLALLANLGLVIVFWLGWRIGDATQSDPVVQRDVTWHFLAGIAAAVFAILAHALVLTYFMGTGRWLEETCRAYRLGDLLQAASRNLKWRLYPAMVAAILLLIATGALGAACDPASAVGFTGAGPLNAAQIHLTTAAVALLVNAAVNFREFRALVRNNLLIEQALSQVRAVRLERGLPVEQT
jgi:hypothetical protein